MLISPPSDVYSRIAEKIVHLIKFMELETSRYDGVAQLMADRHMRDSVRLLAQQTSQYCNELQSLTQTLGIKYNENAARSISEEQVSETSKFLKVTDLNAAEELLQRCCDSEKQLISAYRVVLNEPFVPDDIRKTLRQHLNGILYSFLQLKLLRKEKA